MWERWVTNGGSKGEQLLANDHLRVRMLPSVWTSRILCRSSEPRTMPPQSMSENTCQNCPEHRVTGPWGGSVTTDTLGSSTHSGAQRARNRLCPLDVTPR